MYTAPVTPAVESSEQREVGTVATRATVTVEPKGAVGPVVKRIVEPPPTPAEELMDAMFPPLLGLLIGISLIALVSILLGGGGLSAISAAFLGTHSAWYLSRASAFIAYLLLWWSMALGISITSRLARLWPNGPTLGDLHEHASLLGVVFGLLHGLVLLGDQYIGYTLPQILIPFAGTYMPLWVGFGQIGIYLMIAITVSFYIRQWIGTQAWRAIHFLSYVAFALSLLHGFTSGTDTGTFWGLWIYLSTGVSIAALTFYRIMREQAKA